MKAPAALILLASGAQLASATFFDWRDATKYTNPANTDNVCTSEQKSGFNWSGMKQGSISGYGGFDFKGFSVYDAASFTSSKFKGSKCIKARCSTDYNAAPSFGCAPSKKVERFSVKQFQVSVEYDVTLEFLYYMPSGNTCRQRAFCSKEGTIVKNTQCGGATTVKVILPPGQKKNYCDFAIHHIEFDCSPPSETRPPNTVTVTPSTSQRTRTTTVTPDVPNTTGISTSAVPDKPCTPGTPGCGTTPGTPGRPSTPNVPGQPSTATNPQASTSAVPDKPCVPGTPGCGTTPGTSQRPSTTTSIGGIPSTPGQPSVPGTPYIPGQPSTATNPQASTSAVPDKPCVPGTPGCGTTPGTPQQPSTTSSIGGIPSTPGQPSVPGTPYIPGQPSTATNPQASTSAVPDKPCIPGTPGCGSTTPVTPGKPSTTTVPGTPATPGTPGNPNTPGTPGNPNTPGTPGNPNTPGTPGVPVYPVPTPSTPQQPGNTPIVSTSSLGDVNKPPVGTPTSFITSTVVQTTVSTITKCAENTPNCPAGSTIITTITRSVSTTISAVVPPATPTYGVPGISTSSLGAVQPSPSPPTGGSPTTVAPGESPKPTAPCPPVLPQCLNTWLFDTGCSSNTDVKCMCASASYVNNIYKCLAAYGASDAEINSAQNYFQAICKAQIPNNPAIITGINTVTVTQTVNNPGVPLTTVEVIATITVPQTGGTSIVTSVISTTLTVPQVVFETLTQSQGPVVSLIPRPTATSTAPCTGAACPSTGSSAPTTLTSLPASLVPTRSATSVSPGFTGAANKNNAVGGMFAAGLMAVLAL